jgi:hypothetical protein
MTAGPWISPSDQSSQVQKLFAFIVKVLYKYKSFMYGNPAMACFKYQVYLYVSEAIMYLNALL